MGLMVLGLDGVLLEFMAIEVDAFVELRLFSGRG